MNDTIRLLIADDHQIVRMGLMTIFAREPDIIVVGEAKNGIEAIRLAREHKPDLILMDLMMPKKNGADAAAEILAENPAARILVLTTFGESTDVKRALDFGACGALIKDTPYTKLLAAVRSCAIGKTVISPEIQQTLSEQAAIPELSSRQLEILQFVADGLTTKAISGKIKIGPDGVNAHLRTIFSKLGASSRSEAVAIALRKHLLKIE